MVYKKDSLQIINISVHYSLKNLSLNLHTKWTKLSSKKSSAKISC
jgi:hypothetical protein